MARIRKPLTVAQQACARVGYCVFALGASQCSICGSGRNGDQS